MIHKKERETLGQPVYKILIPKWDTRVNEILLNFKEIILSLWLVSGISWHFIVKASYLYSYSNGGAGFTPIMIKLIKLN